jgi:hypothetical protein
VRPENILDRVERVVLTFPFAEERVPMRSPEGEFISRRAGPSEVGVGHSSEEVPVMGMERRAKRKGKSEPMTAAKAMKPNGGADDCLDKG